MKREKKPRKPHLVRRSIGLLFASLLLILALVFTMMAPGMSTMLDSFAGGVKGTATDAEIEAAQAIVNVVEKYGDNDAAYPWN